MKRASLVKILCLSVLSVLFLVQAALAQGIMGSGNSGYSGFTPDANAPTGSVASAIKNWRKQYPQAGNPFNSVQQQQMPGQDSAPQYQPNIQPGMNPGRFGPGVVVEPAPTPTAQQANPSQPGPSGPKKTPTGQKWYSDDTSRKAPIPYPVPLFVQFSPNTTGYNAPFMAGALQNFSPYNTPSTPVSEFLNKAYQAEGAVRRGQEANMPAEHAAKARLQSSMQHTGNSTENSAQNQTDGNIAIIQLSLINVANEDAGTPTSSSAPFKTLSQAIWMVQQMFKAIFIPFAILLVLPGAVLTQTSSYIKYMYLGAEQFDLDASTPFAGILRGLIAIFLIPATQLIVSYSIDVGNSMTYQVTQVLQAQVVQSWADQLLTPIPPGTQPQQAQEQMGKEGGMAATLRTGFGIISGLLQAGMMVLVAYQVVMVCYLFLMGPIAASFLAWPEGIGSLFRPVFGNWLEALFNLVLWRFWWCVILLVMATRINWLSQMGQYNPQSPWENMVFISFSVMLTYVPFNALDFRPGDMVQQLLDKAQPSSQSGAGSASPGG